MVLTIAFDLCKQSDDLVRDTLHLANLVVKELRYKSIITVISGTKIPEDQIQLFNSFSNIQYSSRETLDFSLSGQKVQFLFRLGADMLNTSLTPLTIPYFAVGNITDSTAYKILNMNEWTNSFGKCNTDNERIDWFMHNVISPMLKEVPTIGYTLSDKMMAVFVGTKPQETISLIKLGGAQRPLNPLPPTNIIVERNNDAKLVHPDSQSLMAKSTEYAVSALDRLRNTVHEIEETSDMKRGLGWCVMPPKVKLLCNWTTSEGLLNDWKHMLHNTVWNKKCEWISSGTPDYWVIINKPPPGEIFDPKRTIVYRMEPYIDTLPQYNDWLNGLHKKDFMFFLDHSNFRNNGEWWLNGTIDELSVQVPKSKILSSVVSSQYVMEGHKLRIDFIKYIQSQSDLTIDVYGHDNQHGFSNYCGPLPEKRKEAGVMPYKYHFAAENSDIENYITEKFWDGLLAECLVFYWGCSNLEDHVDSACFIRLNLKDKEGSLRVIQNAIANDEWSKRINIIQREKKRVLTGFHCFARTTCLLDTKDIEFRTLSRHEIQGIKTSTLNEGNIQLDNVSSMIANFIPGRIQSSELFRMYIHLQVWKQCIKNNKIQCILEGDVKPNFLDNLTQILAAICEIQGTSKGMYNVPEWDIIFLHRSDMHVSPHATVGNIDSPGILDMISKGVKGALSAPSSTSNIINPLLSYLMENTINQGNGQSIISQQTISGAYLIHPRGARKLTEFVDKYGFTMPLNEFFMIMQVSIPQFNLFISWKSLVDLFPIVPGETFHIFRKNQAGWFEDSPRQFNMNAPINPRDILFVKEGAPSAPK